MPPPSSQEAGNARALLVDVAILSILVGSVLVLDEPTLLTQLLLAGVTFLFLLRAGARSGLPPLQIATAIAIALTGELILSPGLGLYTYRDGFIPLFVPFGHGIFYVFALRTDGAVVQERHRRLVTQTVLRAGTVAAILCLLFVNDGWGLLWWLVVVVMISRSRSPFLLSVCFLYTLTLEIIGTSLGVWRWRPALELLGLHSGNPPFGVGVLYCILDLATLSVWTLLAQNVVSPEPLRDAALPQ